MVGALTGTQLRSIPMGVVGWEQFRESHPDAPVLTATRGSRGTTAAIPTRGTTTRTVRFSSTHRIPRTHDCPSRNVSSASPSAGSRWQFVGPTSPTRVLDTDRIRSGQEIGGVGVFRPVLDGRRLTFAVRDGRVVDEQSGSTWNVLGEAISGQLEGSDLPAVVHLDTFWFAWVGFRPDTRLVE